MYSIGVDIGTSTTELIISDIKVTNETNSSLLTVTKLEGAEVIYRSPVAFTPMRDQNIIDSDKLREMVCAALKESRIEKENIETGAVIITGETARKENAEQITAALSQYLGDFVVAAAGPELEGILAGRGAGIGDESKKRNKSIINLDIGGGTLNAVVFVNGIVKKTFALDIGGRLIKFNGSMIVSYILERIQCIIDENELPIVLGNKVTWNAIEILCELLAESCVQVCGLKKLSEDTKRLYITEALVPESIDFISISGGVAEFVFLSDTREDNEKIYERAIEFGDIGPILGRKISMAFEPYSSMLLMPRERIRATVIGAGSHAISVSGSTVGFDKEILPVKNIPIIKSELPPESWAKLAEETKPLTDMYNDRILALSITGKASPSYGELEILSEQIEKLFEGNPSPIVLLLKEDYAKALYQVIKTHTYLKNQLVCLDKVNCENGDYIDIGQPIGSAVPLIIKTLIFKS